MSNTKNLAAFASVLDDGTTGQVLTSQGSGGVTFADASGGGMATYKAISGTDGSPSSNDLYLANVASPSVGDMAYVIDLARIYVYTQSNVWFTIAEISNVSPTAISHSVTHSGGSATAYNSGDTVDLSGVTTAITVALTSTDPDGFPLTWAHTATGSNVSESGGFIKISGTNVSSISYSDSGGNRTYTLTPQAGGVGYFTLNFSATETNGVGAATSSLTFSVGIQYLAIGTLTTNSASASVSDPSQSYDYYCTPEGDFSFVSNGYGPVIWEHVTHKNPTATLRYNSNPSNPASGGYWGITASQDGTRIFGVDDRGYLGLYFYQWNYNLSTTVSNSGNGLIGTVGANSCNFSVSRSAPTNWNLGSNVNAAAISSNGHYLFTSGINKTYIFRWYLSTAFDITTISSAPDQTARIGGSQPYTDIQLSPDDKFIIFKQGNFVNSYTQREFSSSNPLSLLHTTAVSNGNYFFSSSGAASANADPLGACFLNDGNSMFVYDRQNNQIDKYT